MVLRITFAILLATTSFVALADTKDDFIAAVKADCGLSAAEAEALATPGRSGNIIKFRMCPQNPVEITATCKVKCTNTGGSVIGE